MSTWKRVEAPAAHVQRTGTHIAMFLKLGRKRALSQDPTSFAAPVRMRLPDGLRRLAESEHVCHRADISVILDGNQY